MKLKKILYFLSLLLLLFSILIYNSFYGNFETTKDDEGNLITNLPYELTGNKSSRTIIVFLHGWPNTFRLWDHIIKNFEKDNLCLNISYPNYTDKLKLSWGMDLREIARYVKKTIELVENNLQSSAGRKRPYQRIVVSHDWGAFLSYLIDHTYKDFIHEFINLDIGIGNKKDFSQKISIISYQLKLAFNFLIGDKFFDFGNYYTKKFLEKFVPIYGISEKDYEKINTQYNFFYFQLWKNIPFYFTFVKSYKNNSPICYIYGKDKDIMFHSNEFLDMLERDKKNEIFEVSGGHWFMEKKENLELIVKCIKKRIVKLPSGDYI